MCLACHQSIPDQDLAVSLLSHMAKYADVEIDNEMHSSIVHKTVILSAWVQVLLGVFGFLFVIFLVFWWLKKRKVKK